MKTAVIIVTHNSQAVLPRCLAALARQTVPPDVLVLVDSGSVDTGYLQPYLDHQTQIEISVLFVENVGFSQANNIGYQTVSQASDFILFLNPDAFPAPNSIELALAFFADNNNRQAGCIGARLLGFDCDRDLPADRRLDSTGVFRKWYGCWYDRGQGEADSGQYMTREEVPAVCGAFFFCRKSMLEQVAWKGEKGKAVFDPDFFLYKEDIELCLRIKKAGWWIIYLPEITVHHCRGWQQDRQRISYHLRLTAAKSELLLYHKHPSFYMFWALLKYLLVRFLRI